MFLLFNTTLGPELCVKLGEKKIPSGKKGPIFFSSPKLSVGPAGAGNCGVPGISCCGTTDSTLPAEWDRVSFLPFFFPTCGTFVWQQSPCMQGSVPVTSQCVTEQSLPLSTSAAGSAVNALQWTYGTQRWGFLSPNFLHHPSKLLALPSKNYSCFLFYLLPCLVFIFLPVFSNSVPVSLLVHCCCRSLQSVLAPALSIRAYVHWLHHCHCLQILNVCWVSASVGSAWWGSGGQLWPHTGLDCVYFGLVVLNTHK